jgi:hypothetical protein
MPTKTSKRSGWDENFEGGGRLEVVDEKIEPQFFRALGLLEGAITLTFSFPFLSIFFRKNRKDIVTK